MNRIVRLKKCFLKSKASGFSYIEAVVSLLIISLIGVLLASVYSISIKSISKMRIKINDSVEHLRVDDELRDFISCVDYPFWVKEYKVDSSENSITVEYFKGIEGTETKEFKNIEITECDFLRNEQKEPFGLYVKYKLKEQEYETKVLFSSFPFGAVKF